MTNRISGMPIRVVVSFLLCMFVWGNAFSQVELVLKPDAKAGKDAYISSLVPDDSFGDIDRHNTYAWTQNGAVNISRTLIDFNFPCIPPNAIIQEAKLKLFYYPNYPVSHIGVHSGNTQMKIRRIVEPWNEDSTTWNNQPKVSPLNAVISNPVDSDTANVELDLIPLFKDYLANPENSFGFMLSLLIEEPYSNVMVASSDIAEESRRPEFHIKYLIPNNDCLELEIEGPCGFDSEISYLAPSTNFGGGDKLSPYAWTQGGALNISRSLLNFNLDWLPNNSHLTKAELNVFHNNTYPPFSKHQGDLNFQVMEIKEPWNEFAVNWNNQPYFNPNDFVNGMLANDTADIVNLDVLPVLTDMANYHGLVLKLKEETPYSIIILGSSNHPNPQFHPSLTVCYSLDNSGLDDLIEGSKLICFPNPVKQVLTIGYPEKEIHELILYNNSGKVMLTDSTHFKGPKLIEVSDFKPGIYYLSILGDDGVNEVQRIIIE